MKGTYLATITDHVLKEIGEKNTPAVNFTFETIENVQTKEPEVKTVYCPLWLTDNKKAWEITMDTLTKVIGWNGDDLSDLNGTGDFVGKEVWLVLDEEEYNGKIQTKVKFINRVGGQTQKPFDPEKAKSLSEKLKGKVLAYRQNSPVSEPVDDGLKF